MPSYAHITLMNTLIFGGITIGIATLVAGHHQIATSVIALTAIGSLWNILNQSTTRQRVRRELADALSGASIDATLCVESDLTIVAANQACERILGFKSRSLIGRRISDLWPNRHHLSRLQEAVHANLVSPLPISERVQFDTGYRKDGTTFPMEISLNTVHWQTTPLSVITIRDRSELEHSNHQARRTSAFHQSLMESSLSARLVINQEGTVVEYNSAAAQTLGFRRSEILGKKMVDMIVPEHYREQHERGMAHFLKTHSGPVINQRTEISAINAKGEEFPIELTISPVQVDDVFYFSAEIRDISSRLLHEQELKEAKEQAEASNEAKSNFLATMSHEIRTPLNAVMGILNLLRSSESDPRKQELLRTAEHSGRSLLDIISDVLDYSKIEAGKMSLENEELSLPGLLNETASLFSHSAYSKGLALTTFFDSSLPAEIKGDRAKLSQILKNLVANAVKFTETGWVDVRFEQTQPGTITVVVEDTGIGISQDQCNDIFEVFQQADNSDSRKFGGTGLGLAICKRLADLMGAELNVTSTPGKGSAFSLSWQLQCPSAQTIQLVTPPRAVYVLSGDHHESASILRQLRNLGLSCELVQSLHEIPQFDQHSAEVAVLFTSLNLMPNLPSNSDTQGARFIFAGKETGGTALTNNYTGQTIAPYININQVIDALDLAQQDDTQQLDQALSVNRRFDGKRVLLVEDSRSNQIVIAELLESLGCTVDIASNGIEAFSSAMTLPFDLILMDVQMPEMNGLEATRQIRKLGGNLAMIPIIAITAKVFQEDVDACHKAGMNDYLSKPIHFDKLKETLATWLPESSASITTREVLELEELVGRDKVKNMLGKYLEELESRTRTVTNAAAHADLKQISAECHTIKSTSRTFGFQRLSDVAEKLELAAAKGTQPQQSELNELFEEVELSLQLVREYAQTGESQ